jgi:hypothetical protein
MINQRAVYVFKRPEEKLHRDSAGVTFTKKTSDFLIPTEAMRYRQGHRGDREGFHIHIRRSSAAEWQFKVLTIEEFKRKYYKLVEGGQTLAAKIKTTDDLHQWYRREFKI